MTQRPRSRGRAAPARATATAPPAPARGVAGARDRPAVVMTLLLAAALATQWGALRLPFLADDFLFLDAVRGHRALELFQVADPIGNFWRPFSRQAWFMLLSHVGGESALPFHVMNVALFLGLVALLFAFARRLAGTRAAAVAAGLMALTYAADVPVRWASGCQDLLATVGALGALELHARRRTAWAGVALALALLSKETVVATAVVAVLADRAERPWRAALRRALPLFAVTALWAVARLARARGAPLPTEAVHPDAPLAVIAHAAQVTVGAVWAPGDLAQRFAVVPPLLPLAALLAAVALAWRVPAPAPPPPATPSRLHPADLAGLGLALLGAAPIVAVASIWSAYFYLFALCGCFLLVGRQVARAPWAPAALVVALLAWSDAGARRVDEFATAPGAWTLRSHVNRLYLDRAMARIDRCLALLRAQHPRFPHGSRLYFAGAPSFAAWQVGDGPLVRWAYRDTTLRSYFMTEFDGRRGASTYLFEFVGDTLLDHTAEPGFLDRLVYTALCEEDFALARRLLAGRLADPPADTGALYLLALVEARDGHAEAAATLMRRAGLALGFDAEAELRAARAALARHDTTAAVDRALRATSARPLDPRPHELLSDLMLLRPSSTWTPVEPFAGVALAPRDPQTWWRWALVQTSSQCYEEAARTLERFRRVAGPARRDAPEVRALADYLQRQRVGGADYRADLREDARRSGATGGR